MPKFEENPGFEGAVREPAEASIPTGLLNQVRSGLLPYLTVAVGVIGCGAAQQAQKPDDSGTFQQLLESKRTGSPEKLTDSTLNKLAISLLERSDVSTFNHLRTLHPEWKPVFRGAKLQIRYLMNAQLTDADFSQANLYGTDFSGAVLVRAKFNGAKLHNTHFNDNADLSRSSTLNAHFTNVTFVGGHFQHAELFSTAINGGDYSHADFTSAGMENIDFFAGNFTGAQFVHAQLTFGKFGHRAILRSVNFSDANLQHANMNGSKFYKTIFYYAVFSDVSLCGADFASADLTDATFDDVKVDGIDESGNIKGKKPGDLTPGQIGTMRKRPTLPLPNDGR